MKIIDATDSIVGRLASLVAKMVIDGEQVVIVNAEKAVISGNPRTIISFYIQRIHRGYHYKGPFFPKMPDRFIRRTIRGMLPYRSENGWKAFRRVKVYIGMPDKYKAKAENISSVKKTVRIKKFILLKDLCTELGGKVEI